MPYPVHNFGMDKFAQMLLPAIMGKYGEGQDKEKRAMSLALAQAQSGKGDFMQADPDSLDATPAMPTAAGQQANKYYGQGGAKALYDIKMAAVESKKFDRQIGVLGKLPELLKGFENATTPQGKSLYKKAIQDISKLGGLPTDYTNLNDLQIKGAVTDSVVDGIYKLQEDFNKNPNPNSHAMLLKGVNAAMANKMLGAEVGKSILTGANQTMKGVAEAKVKEAEKDTAQVAKIQERLAKEGEEQRKAAEWNRKEQFDYQQYVIDTKKEGKKPISPSKWKERPERMAVVNAMKDPEWQFSDEVEQGKLIEKHKRFLTGKTGSPEKPKGQKDKFGYIIGEEKQGYKYIGNDRWQKL